MGYQLFWNGDIITMEQEEDKVEAVLTKDGYIEKVGMLEEVKEWTKGQPVEEVDLQGKTLMPAFIDAHSHITAFAQTLGIVSLSHCTSIQEVIQTLQNYREKRNLSPEEWIIGFGYDHNFLKEKRHPNKFDLDKVSLENPILISHASGHMGVMNSAGLKRSNITEQTKDPEGGSYGRVAGSQEPDGYMEEDAFIHSSQKTEAMSLEDYKKLVEEAQEIYLKYGIKTVQDGLTKAPEFMLLKQMAEEKRLKVDIVSYVDILGNKKVVEENEEYVGKKYHNRLRIGGYKAILDGSPQGKTAWMTTKYEGEESYRGYPARTDEEVKQFIDTALQEDRQILVHCNGDAAADQYIKIFTKEVDKYPREIRPVMIHAQTVRFDQLKKMKKIKMIPSFFVAHTYYWGDVHIKNLGKQRAFRISPAKEAEELGMCYTFHQDTPVLPPNMLQTVWCAVNRITKEGVVVGEEEKVSVYEALKAVTIHAAYQYFEEKEKGSIKEGKRADFVILDRNPLKVPKMEIKDIKVVEVI